MGSPAQRINPREIADQVTALRTCIKIDTKYRSIQKEEDKITRWRQTEGRSASIEKAQDIIYQLQTDLNRLCQERDEKQMSLRW